MGCSSSMNKECADGTSDTSNDLTLSNGAVPPQSNHYATNGTTSCTTSRRQSKSYHTAVVAGPHPESTLRSASSISAASQSKEVVLKVTRLTVNADKVARDNKFHASVKATFTAFDARGIEVDSCRLSTRKEDDVTTSWLLSWVLPKECSTIHVSILRKTNEAFSVVHHEVIKDLVSAFRDGAGLLAQVSSGEVTLALETSTKTRRLRPRRKSPHNQCPLRQDSDLVISPDNLKDVEMTVALTIQEEVICIDSWNKILGWKDLLMDHVYKQLLSDHTDLHTLVGPDLRHFPALLFGLFDLAIRSIRPSTEIVQREAYRGVHTDGSVQPCSTIEEYADHFADVGFRGRHWQSLRPIFLWSFEQSPYMEEYEMTNLALGKGSALSRFFNLAIFAPMLAGIDRHFAAIDSDVARDLSSTWHNLDVSDSRIVGGYFYAQLFEAFPQSLDFFGTTDMDKLSGHFKQTIDLLVATIETPTNAIPRLIELGQMHRAMRIPSQIFPLLLVPLVATVKHFFGANWRDEMESVWRVLYTRAARVIAAPTAYDEKLITEAIDYLSKVADELNWDAAVLAKRIVEVRHEIVVTGTYTHSYEELALGCQLAWRNSSKCIGRIHWNNLQVRDKRHVTDPDDIFEEVLEHMKMATAGVNIVSIMTVFEPKHPTELWGLRFWGEQVVRYACYTLDNGTVLGDRACADYTKQCLSLGWQPPTPKTNFDILPIVIQPPGQAPKLYDLPKEAALQVELTHPDFPDFDKLGLKWVAVPAISSFRITIGGIDYCAAPFNGWFMGTEIGRDLIEPGRYDLEDALAKAFRLNTASEQTLWRDMLWVHANRAILHSYAAAKISLVDHMTASRQFLTHDLREKKKGRECPAQWSWVVPPMGGSRCPVWHHEMRDFMVHPQYHYQSPPFSNLSKDDARRFSLAIDTSLPACSSALLIAFGTESGTAEQLAVRLGQSFRELEPTVVSLDAVTTSDLLTYETVLIVVSTFGDGERPRTAANFFEEVDKLPGDALNGVSFSVLGLGSRIYSNFCAAAVQIDSLLSKRGAERLVPVHTADELSGQMATFRTWQQLVARIMGVATGGGKPKQLAVVFHDDGTGVPAVSALGTAVELIRNDELVSTAKDARSTRHIAFAVGDTGLSYETGDHLAVYPCSSSGEVERLIAALKIPASHLTRVFHVKDEAETRQESTSMPYATPTTVRQVLTDEVDLTLREPFDTLLNRMATRAADPAEARTLHGWVEVLGSTTTDDEQEAMLALKVQILDNYLFVADLLEAFSSVTLELIDLLEILPKQKPRFYSISSASELWPSEIHLTVGVVEVVTDAGRQRPGLCSAFLAGLDPHQRPTVRVFVRQSELRAQAELTVPVMMIGPGTGVSPMIGFLEQRQAAAKDPATLGRAVLYFGCRTEADYLYADRLKKWQADGILSRLEVAFSRGPDTPKTYVQHLMLEQGVRVWEMLSNGGAVYICGDSLMADDVQTALHNILQQHSGLDRLGVVDYLRTMRETKRLQLDVWGVTLNYKATLATLQQKRSTQAKVWLAKWHGKVAVTDSGVKTEAEVKLAAVVE
eukprot:m.69061 g.69061  ORF g.69061 m.69061 type:complete len:1558 (-) comp18369_c0_seq1:350-5023(-)